MTLCMTSWWRNRLILEQWVHVGVMTRDYAQLQWVSVRVIANWNKVTHLSTIVWHNSVTVTAWWSKRPSKKQWVPVRVKTENLSQLLIEHFKASSSHNRLYLELLQENNITNSRNTFFDRRTLWILKPIRVQGLGKLNKARAIPLTWCRWRHNGVINLSFCYFTSFPTFVALGLHAMKSYTVT